MANYLSCPNCKTEYMYYTEYCPWSCCVECKCNLQTGEPSGEEPIEVTSLKKKIK